MLTIRGIPLHKLDESGFCPAIHAIKELWQNRHGTNPVNQSFAAHFLAGSLAILACLSLVAICCGAPKEAIATLIAATLFMGGVVATIAVLARNFVWAVNRIDAFLVKNKYDSLPEFPASCSGISEYLDKICFKIILLLRLHEREFGTMDPRAAEQRERLKEFKEAVEQLGFALKPYDYYFQMADLQLDQEEAERKKKPALTGEQLGD